jgi:hypothetical protein
MAEPAVDPRARELGHEPSDAPWGRIWLVLASFFALALAGGALLAFMIARFEAVRDPPAPAPVERIERIPPPPQLRTAPGVYLARFRAEKRAVLESGGWVDREAGIAALPIEDAMRLLAERGWPQPVTGDGHPPPWPEAAR